jgi:hypothetical protein
MPKALRILHLSFTDPCLTHFGGMILIQFLQQAQTPLDDTEICQDPSTQYQLSSFRSNPGTPLRHHDWNAENQQNRNSSRNRVVPTIQRSFSLPIRIPKISGPVYALAFFQEDSS